MTEPSNTPQNTVVDKVASINTDIHVQTPNLAKNDNKNSATKNSSGGKAVVQSSVNKQAGKLQPSIDKFIKTTKSSGKSPTRYHTLPNTNRV